jgi:hypothetical protein
VGIYYLTGVLRGHEHTTSHDLESFFYVLYLFLHTYDGPLATSGDWPRQEMFVTGRTRRLSHVRNWPINLQSWTNGNYHSIANDKTGRMSDTDFVWDSLRVELPSYWRDEEAVSELVRAAYDVFWRPVEGTRTRFLRADVRHSELIDALEGWMQRHPQSTIDKGCQPPRKPKSSKK